jgi:antitoxin component YwqK of YwqJK toxin-antitoxin module
MSKDIRPRNNKGEPHGLWESYYSGGNLMLKGFYHNGKRLGYNEWYHWNNSDKLREKTYYI